MKYPLKNRTVLYSHKKHLQPIPEVGKIYHCFDDGKISFSRHFLIKVDEVLGHQQFKKKYPEQFKLYREAVKRSYWLYSTHSDKFIITHKGENNELGVYVRTKQGGWFGIGTWWNSAALDVTGILWEGLISRIDEFIFTPEEKQKIIESNELWKKGQLKLT
jgi:hypothetical protein